jgi:hypothetical protein
MTYGSNSQVSPGAGRLIDYDCFEEKKRREKSERDSNILPSSSPSSYCFLLFCPNYIILVDQANAPRNRGGVRVMGPVCG